MKLVRRLGAWIGVNDVSTDDDSTYPELGPLEIELSPADAYGEALAAARAMPRWTVVSQSPDELRLAAEARTRWLGFVDDVEVWITGKAGGPSRVHVRSRSRVGRGDLGTNAGRIRAYLDGVASRISSSRAR